MPEIPTYEPSDRAVLNWDDLTIAQKQSRHGQFHMQAACIFPDLKCLHPGGN